jgi:hypothetical protein
LDKASESKQDQRGLLFAAVAGFFFFVALLKFGNPVILDSQVTPPENFYEFLYQLWPVRWGYIGVVMLIIVGLIAIASGRDPVAPVRPRFRWYLALPLLWFIWQLVSAGYTVDSKLTDITLRHFTMCVALFYLGYFALGHTQNPWPLWLFLTIALLWIVRVGFEQHFGGLEQTRKYFYQLPNWREAPPEFLKKLESNRIYSTLFYPNTLAGALLLVVPITIGFAFQVTTRFQTHVRWLIAALITIPALACLYWSGSKAGWLIALVLALVAFAGSKLPKRSKQIVIAAILVCGLVGFGIRYAQFFKHGSTSVVARFDYWRAALIIGKQNPLLGTGPGTFAIPYRNVKLPDAEMTRLTHNDYLQQLSDSGIPGFILFFGWTVAVISLLYRYRKQISPFVTLGVLGVVLHQTVDFHLYIPAIAWLTFFLIGWLLARARIAKSTVS